MKKLFVILIICLLTYSSYCQGTSGKRDTTIKDIRKKSIYFELGGNGIYYSINYERLFFSGKSAWLAIRIGLAPVADEMVIIPLEISRIFGKKHCFELGVGTTFALEGPSYVDMVVFFRVGYRYRADSGFLFRIAPLLLVAPPDFNILPFGGISVGYSF